MAGALYTIQIGYLKKSCHAVLAERNLESDDDARHRRRDMRGYDDTQMLQEMAEGVFSRKYGSVDEAAKAVTGEEGGSNVDRLRRKFRTDDWFGKGLEIHVENVIKARALVPPQQSVVVYVDSLFWKQCREWFKIVLGTLDLLTTFRDKGSPRSLSIRELLGRRAILAVPILTVGMIAQLSFDAYEKGLETFLSDLPVTLMHNMGTFTLPVLLWLAGERLTTVRWNTVYRKIKAERIEVGAQLGFCVKA